MVLTTALYASLSYGWQDFPLLHPDVTNDWVTRVEAGATRGDNGFYAVLQLSAHNGPYLYYEPPPTTFAGDVRFTQTGFGVRHTLALGRFRLVPHVDAGAAFADVGMNAAYFHANVQPLLAPNALGLHTVGLWAQAGADLAWPVVPDAVDVYLAPDVGVMTIGGLEPTLDIRLGLTAHLP